MKTLWTEDESDNVEIVLYSTYSHVLTPIFLDLLYNNNR